MANSLRTLQYETIHWQLELCHSKPYKVAFQGKAGRPAAEYRSVIGHRDQPFAVAVGVTPTSAAAVRTSAAPPLVKFACAGYHVPSEPRMENAVHRVASTPAGHTDELARGPTGDGAMRVRGPSLPGPEGANDTVAEREPGGPPPGTADE